MLSAHILQTTINGPFRPRDIGNERQTRIN
jgi:hypothetical protein